MFIALALVLGDRMRILYVGLLYNYGKKEEGYSYEHFNLEAGLKDCVDKGLFDVTFMYPDHHPEDINQSIVEFILNGEADAIFHVAFNESLDLPEPAARFALKKDIPVIQWDCDSSWRFGNWILPRKDRVSHFVTTHSHTLDWYKRNDMKVIRSQWAGSPYYHSSNAEKEYDCTFVGQKHGQHQTPDGIKFLRAETIDAMMTAGIDIDLFGSYWDGYDNWHGYLKDFHDMVKVFDQTRVCLNLSNPWHYGTLPQIKGRHFEIPQINGFQLCTPADDLSLYFEEGKEIVVGYSQEDLISKAKYYIEHDIERTAIANAGRARMLKDHQWSHRFESIFKEIGLL